MMNVNTERLVYLIDQHVECWNKQLDSNPDLATPDWLFQHNHVMNTLSLLRRTAENTTTLKEVEILTEAVRLIIKDNDPKKYL